MQIPSGDDLERQVTDHKVRWLGGLLVAAGVLTAAISSGITLQWVNVVLVTVGGALISVGALSLVFDVALRRSVYDEMYKLSGINKNIAENQFIGSMKSSEIKWDQVIFERSCFKFVLQDPLRFVDQNIGRLFDASRDRSLDVTIFVPDTDQSIASILAGLLGYEVKEFQSSVDQAVRNIENAWNYRLARNQIQKGSSIEVRSVKEVPLYSLAVCDSLTIVSISRPFGRAAEPSDYSYIHLGRQSSYPSEWYRDGFADVQSSPIRFASQVK